MTKQIISLSENAAKKITTKHLEKIQDETKIPEA